MITIAIPSHAKKATNTQAELDQAKAEFFETCLEFYEYQWANPCDDSNKRYWDLRNKGDSLCRRLKQCWIANGRKF